MAPPHTHRLAWYRAAWLARWVGYRAAPPLKKPEYIIWLRSWIGAFCGISLMQAVFGQAKYFIDRDVSLTVASYGATVVLVYCAIEAPLAQPRAVFGGHFISGLIGVRITKLVTVQMGFLTWLFLSLGWLCKILVSHF